MTIHVAVLFGYVAAIGIMVLDILHEYGPDLVSLACVLVPGVSGFLLLLIYGGPPMTLGTMRRRGASLVLTRCTCGRRRAVEVDALPDDLDVPAVRRRLLCPDCGLRPVEVRPDWSGMRAHAARQVSVAAGGVLFRYRVWIFPLFVACVLAARIPPSRTFGSEALEHVKDGGAIFVALAGLTLRALVARRRPNRDGGRAIRADTLITKGAFSVCRNPLYLGNCLIALGILLMHGDPTVILGVATCVMLAHRAIVAAEEDTLSQRFGAAYALYCEKVPRWSLNLPALLTSSARQPVRLGHVLVADHAAIGLTVGALAFVEFYEEIEEPVTGAGDLYLGLLVTLMTLALVWTCSLGFVKRRLAAAP